MANPISSRTDDWIKHEDYSVSDNKTTPLTVGICPSDLPSRFIKKHADSWGILNSNNDIEWCNYYI